MLHFLTSQRYLAFDRRFSADMILPSWTRRALSHFPFFLVVALMASLIMEMYTTDGSRDWTHSSTGLNLSLTGESRGAPLRQCHFPSVSAFWDRLPKTPIVMDSSKVADKIKA
jgi:hypothetical protein